MLNAAGQHLHFWAESPYHRAWLTEHARKLLDLHGFATLNPRGGFFDLDDEGRPIRDADGSGTRALHATTRMVFCHAVGHLMGHPGSAAIVDYGMAWLWTGHRDAEHGGYLWSLNDAGPVDATKQAYGHAFVLLAAASAKVLGHPDADRLLIDATDLILTRFWEPGPGAAAEEFSREWASLGSYRGQTANMPLTEALMAAFEATADERYLAMAESIADLLIRRITAANEGRIPEHFDDTWTVDRDYKGSPMFRPAGTTPGHWLEWSRLLVQLWIAGGGRRSWMPDAAEALFRNAITEGWDAEHGGFFYTLDHGGRPLDTDKIWWPACEGIAAAHFLTAHGDDPMYETWYRTIWDWSARHLVDPRTGGWVPQLDRTLQPKSTLFTGRPDLYHALQACLIPLFPADGGLLRVAARLGGPDAPEPDAG